MNHAQAFQAEAWRLIPKLDMPELFPPAVMFGILDHDPHATFSAALQRSAKAADEKGLQPPPPLTSTQMRQLMLRAAWDSVFHEIPGNRVGLLIQEPGLLSTAPGGGSAQYAVLIGSTEPPGKKWIVTRATEHGGKTVCWCLPVDVAPGRTTEVVLTAKNMIMLESA